MLIKSPVLKNADEYQKWMNQEFPSNQYINPLDFGAFPAVICVEYTTIFNNQGSRHIIQNEVIIRYSDFQKSRCTIDAPTVVKNQSEGY